MSKVDAGVLIAGFVGALAWLWYHRGKTTRPLVTRLTPGR